ncbi:multisubunit Na+/H+ antiporter MnhC subunit [Micromonospora sp. Llam0]|uniref:sodium:proton antiporter n=1 Tax=Micromonospora sp. Llam0 TaxID=2485143 RepID=UPI000F47167F|nr:NADH-quinone oxidoreductase subunit K [Micromonospora sp. Llam0]ROO61286.1 multisubunit Na+/H+ antiporter MnhC subunit [Micromonospora sp. Llam0]
MTVALVIGLLTAAGVYLILHRGLIRVVIGFVLLGHAVNILLLASGGLWRRQPPFGDVDPAATADPLPQAFALTAIVITFGITIFLLALAVVDRPRPGRPDLELGEAGPDGTAAPDSAAGPKPGPGPEPVLTEPRSMSEQVAEHGRTAAGGDTGELPR